MALLVSLPGMFFMLDRDRKLVRWNVERERFLGYEPEEISAMAGFLESIAPEDRPEVERLTALVRQHLADEAGEGDR